MTLTKPKPRSVSIHSKRRQGQHHKRSHDFHKTYWPYLPMALIVSFGIIANTFWGTIQKHVLAYATDMSISGLLQETNDERSAAGLTGLSLNALLNQAAQAKADDMATRDYWSHSTPEGNEPWVFFVNAGYNYQTAGENLAYGFDNSTEAVVGWMNSPGHKANILNGSYKEVGFGVANSANYQGTGPETIVVAMYASPKVASEASPVANTPKPQPTPAPALAPAPESKPTPTPPAEEVNQAPAEDKKESAPAPAPVVAREVSRIQLLSGAAAPWSMFAITAIATIAFAIFLLRHGMLLHRVLVKSEAFIHKHPFLDIALFAIAVVGIVLTRTDGIIR